MFIFSWKYQGKSTPDIKSYIFGEAGNIELVLGRDSDIQADDLLNALEVFSNKEEIDKICRF